MARNDVAILAMTATYGLALLALIVVNVFVALRRRQSSDGPSPGLGRSAWGLSFGALFLVVLAPVPLVMALVDIGRSERNRPKYHSVPARMALLNSVVAAGYFIILMLAVFVFEWL